VRNTPPVREGWRALEERIETDRITAETEALEALGEGDDEGAAKRLTTFMEEAVDAALARADELRTRLS
jgi:hypothetical protein